MQKYVITLTPTGQPAGEVTFTRVAGTATQRVLYRGERMGTMVPHRGGWQSTHRDGTPGPWGRTKVDAAWALLNS